MLASEAAAGIGGRLVGPDVEFDGASFDTRSLVPGQLFVPIVAERNGHEFIGDAYDAGAVLHLTSEPDDFRREHTAIEVADTGRALMQLAEVARRGSPATVVGVTGSVGKTSTKDLVAAACAAQRRTTANERSFNNEQGLPITILNAPDDAELLVLEMGMRGVGQIAALCEIARPDIGVVTAVGHSHTELVGGIEGVARAKRELVEALPKSGTAILNADDERVAAMERHTGAAVLTYGRSGDVRVSDLVLDELARPLFGVETPWGAANVELAVSGEHMALNAAAAIAVAGSVGVDLDAAVAGLADAGVSAMRMEVVRLANGAVVINDAYNANPTSMRAALDSLAALTAARRVAVLGAMGELGDDSDEAHAQVAAHAGRLGIEVLAVDAPAYGTEVAHVSSAQEAFDRLAPVGAGTAVLIKASRAAGLERLAGTLAAPAGANDESD